MCIKRSEIFSLKSDLEAWWFELEVALSVNCKLEVARRKASRYFFKTVFGSSLFGIKLVYTVIKVLIIFSAASIKPASHALKTAFSNIN